MDPVQNSQPQPNIQPDTQLPVQQPAQEAPLPPAKKSHNVMYIGLFIALIAVGVMLYFIISNNKTNTQAIQQENNTPVSNVDNTKSAEEKEVESVDIGNPEPTELIEVEENINKL
jgi:flagellar basal body-associated protein FliL